MPGSSSLKWHGNKIFRNMLNAAVKTNQKIVAISNFTKTELENRYPAQKNKFITIYNGIENFWFNNKFEQNKISNQLKDEKYWIWWGYISNRKNLKRLTEAYLSLVKKGNKLPKILFIGDISPDQAYLKQTFEKYSQYFYHYPFQQPYVLKNLVKNSKGLLFPSLYEGFGLPVIETFSQGAPVLHSNITSLPEIAGGLGIKVNPYDLSSIEEGLLKLSNYKLSQERSNNLKIRANMFTYETAARQFAKLIEEQIC
jgi:glycosyltransferase involved in cell wall biosynthesis